MDLTEVHEQIDWLAAGTAGPLAPSRLTLKQVEVNAQVVRLPSGMETEFGGQAIYLMRIFAAEPSGAGLRFRLLLAHLFPCSRYASTTTRSGVR
jgi:hypothetical protein